MPCRTPRFDPWVGKIPWRREWQPTPVFLPGEFPLTEEPGELQSMGLPGWDTNDLMTEPPPLHCTHHTMNSISIKVRVYQESFHFNT